MSRSSIHSAWVIAAITLGMFAVFYGLDWVATVPPTLHGDYHMAFWIASVLCLIAGTAFITVGRRAMAPRSAALA